MRFLNVTKLSQMYFYAFSACPSAETLLQLYAVAAEGALVWCIPVGTRRHISHLKNTIDSAVPRNTPPAIPRGPCRAAVPGRTRGCGRCRPAPGLCGPQSGRRCRRAAHSGAASPLRYAQPTRLAADSPPPPFPLCREKTLTLPSPRFILTPFLPGEQGDMATARRSLRPGPG